MTPRNIRQADLNLLIALNVLMEERNVTRAADRLGLTQSAASRMLGRLRATFDDPLFVRTSRGLTPTKRALDLAGPLREYLAGLEKLLLERGDFDPRRRSGGFALRLSTTCRRSCSRRWLRNCRIKRRKLISRSVNLRRRASAIWMPESLICY